MRDDLRPHPRRRLPPAVLHGRRQPVLRPCAADMQGVPIECPGCAPVGGLGVEEEGQQEPHLARLHACGSCGRRRAAWLAHTRTMHMCWVHPRRSALGALGLQGRAAQHGRTPGRLVVCRCGLPPRQAPGLVGCPCVAGQCDHPSHTRTRPCGLAGYAAGDAPLPGPNYVPAGDLQRTFGAKGDGKADDTDAFRAAIASVKNAAVLYIPAGVGLLDGTRTQGSSGLLAGRGRVAPCPRPAGHVSAGQPPHIRLLAAAPPPPHHARTLVQARIASTCPCK